MGDSVAEGTVLQWHKREGDAVVAEETLLEISTDKVDAEVPAPASGTLVKIHAAEGDSLAVGAVLAEIAADDPDARPAGRGNGAPAPEPAPAAATDATAPAAGNGAIEAERPAAGDETESPAAGGETERPAAGGETERPAAGDETERPAAGGETERPAAGDDSTETETVDPDLPVSGEAPPVSEAEAAAGAQTEAEGVASAQAAVAGDTIEIVTPTGGESVSEGTILEWAVKVGDAVADGQTVVELSTDKVDMELPAPAAGTITEILAREGETVSVGQVIARMAVASATPAAPAADTPAADTPSPAAPSPALATTTAPQTPDRSGPAGNGAPAPAPAHASPLARRIAAAEGIDLSTVRGTARGGRITKADVLAAGNGAGAHAAATAPPTPAPDAEPATPAGAQLIKGSGAALARYMERSRSIPTATSVRTLTVTTLDARRRQLREAEQRVSFTHLIAYAIARVATEEMPVMAHHFAEIDGKPHRVDDDAVNLGLAVDVERRDGTRTLMVPVIRDAGRLGFDDFLAAYGELVEKARGNALTADDLAGANLTLTNPGGIGTVASVPRLMEGQGTIVATGAIAYPPGLGRIGAQIGAEKVMTMTSTYDHRIIQGAESGRFLQRVEALLQGESEFYERVFADLGVTLAPLPTPAEAATTPAPATRPAPAPAPATTPTPAEEAAPAPAADPERDEQIMRAVQAADSLLKAHRTHGHLAARLDPLGREAEGDPALDPGPLGLTTELMATIPSHILRMYVPGATLAEALPVLRETYCGTIAYEIEHIGSHRQRLWLREAIESGAFRAPLSADEQKALLKRLTQVDAFERFMHKAYLGQKQFSVEGLDMTVPMLDELIQLAASRGAREIVIGMAHRGRLNVLAHNLGRPYDTIFAEFEGSSTLEPITTLPQGGTGDVKYHHGAQGSYQISDGESVIVRLESNPSHLEFVCPVAEGATRAAQTTRQGPHAHQDTNAAIPIILHGDAAFPGQGIVAETLNLQALDGYTVGGTVHIIQNNQVGFTTDADDARSTAMASDLAKGFDVPIIHVNADDVAACVSAVRLAFAFRQEFGHDVLIDLIGYRRFGHNEADEPAYTQPEMYSMIKRHPSVRELYARELIDADVVSEQESTEMTDGVWTELTECHAELKERIAAAKHVDHATGEYQLDRTPSPEVKTAVALDRLQVLNEELLAVPDGFTVHPKLLKQLEQRREALATDERKIVWAHAEALAFASLLSEGIPIRLTGQDTERGTFSQRHLVLHDPKTGQEHCAMQHLPGALAPMELHNSPLSEMACVGFEYGYSQEGPETLVLWEAQFGDFVNGAQVIIDQFISSGLAKWGQTSRLTLLLPHAYEGSGPEHSSARLERFLQLAAEGNIRVANPTTPAQYFHLLRRQARIAKQRPLVVMTPKSLLRLAHASSSTDQLVSGRFRPVLPDPSTDPQAVTRLVLCTGKIFYDLLGAPARVESPQVALGRVELLYPFPQTELMELVDTYPNLREVVWVQEEPRNMGARAFMSPRLLQVLPEHLQFGYIGRPERAASGEGYPIAHATEQKRIVSAALDADCSVSQFPLMLPGER
ncbi:MAG: multifunctional oxoglutarate decarboxylase/oxoglutarate dehydrogenase thiamine pyrophosphate-binding subunit/dihydrolipoyllysine-residue succinyltransferase subunit [Solirubrobacterales bacterium]|nr:multifunctional oxoglutarate decarboxylase/oxoglutarate dehydrogenase thiamine pyrophosphate-binding subunit/dihydrolipoyllysine-residue succinyltransferase subunit [Solirubrobacterales bacterium]